VAHFCFSDYNRFVSVSFKPPFLKKTFKTLFTVCLVWKFITWILFSHETCVSRPYYRILVPKPFQFLERLDVILLGGTLWIFVYHRSNYEPVDNRTIYFRGLFNNAVSIVVYVAPNIRMIDELRRIWKAAVVASSRHLRKDLKKKNLR